MLFVFVVVVCRVLLVGVVRCCFLLFVGCCVLFVAFLMYCGACLFALFDAGCHALFVVSGLSLFFVVFCCVFVV